MIKSAKKTIKKLLINTVNVYVPTKTWTSPVHPHFGSFGRRNVQNEFKVVT